MDIVKFYKEEIAARKTPASKKAYCTKQIKAAKEHLDDLLKYKKPRSGMKWGYLHGEPITSLRIINAKTELRVLEKLKSEIK
jgi:hypothetical protein